MKKISWIHLSVFMALTAGPGLSLACLPVSDVTASSVYGTNTAAKAYDANTGTRWESVHSSDPQWITYDLGSPKSVNRVRIDWETASASNYQVKGSLDNSSWIDMVSRTSMPSSQHRIDDNSGLSGIFRYIRIYGTARSTTYGYSIWETEIYGEDVSQIPPAAPAGLQLLAEGNSQVVLSWTDNAINEHGFNIFVNESPVKPAAIRASTGANASSYTAADLSPEVLYYFWVEAFNGAGVSSAITGNLMIATGALISDDFAVSDNPVLGNGWVETESANHYASILNGKMQLTTADGTGFLPVLTKSFSPVTSGLVEWNFVMDWTRTSENIYEVLIQLGDNTMTAANAGTGAGISLRWGDMGGGFASQGGFGFVNPAGADVQVSSGSLSGEHTINVLGSLDSKTYNISIDGILMQASVPFQNNVNLNQMRVMTTNVGTGIIGKSFDQISLMKVPSGGYYTVTAPEYAHGSINPFGDVSVVRGGAQTFSITPEAGYEIAELKVDGIVKPALRGNAPSEYAFNNVITNHTLDVTFKLISYLVTPQITGSGTIVTVPSGPAYPEHSQVLVSITPNTGYVTQFVFVVDATGKSTPYYNASTLTIPNLTVDHTIYATFIQESEDFLKLSGGTMLGPITMEDNYVTLDAAFVHPSNGRDYLVDVVLDGTGLNVSSTSFYEERDVNTSIISPDSISIKTEIFDGTAFLSGAVTSLKPAGIETPSLRASGSGFLDVGETLDAQTALMDMTGVTATRQSVISGTALNQGVKLSPFEITIASSSVSQGGAVEQETKITAAEIVTPKITTGTIITNLWQIQEPPADYVFAPDYNLRDLSEVEKFITANKHLPDVPGGKEMLEKGLDLSAMNMQLLRKVEELTLYAIRQEKLITTQQERMQAQETRLRKLEGLISGEGK